MENVILKEINKSGQTAGMEDVLIAASALANQCTMLTASVRPFSKIDGLIVEKWTTITALPDSRIQPGSSLLGIWQTVD